MLQAVDPAKIENYHAHIYYGPDTRRAAARLRTMIESNFTVEMGRWPDEPVGPHPRAMYQVKFAKTKFNRIVPWLMLNRRGLDILVHPNTGDAYEDHATHALWLGQKLQLRIAVLRNPRKA